MAYRVDISLSALQDAEDAYLWIMRRAPSQAGAWYDGLLKAVYGLDQNPTRCPMAPESEDVGILIWGRRLVNDLNRSAAPRGLIVTMR